MELHAKALKAVRAAGYPIRVPNGGTGDLLRHAAAVAAHPRDSAAAIVAARCCAFGQRLRQGLTAVFERSLSLSADAAGATRRVAHSDERSSCPIPEHSCGDWFERWQQRDGPPEIFLDVLAENLVWTATGNSPISGTYKGRDAYTEGIYRRLDERLESWPRPTVERIIAQGEWGVVEFTSTGGRGKNGTDYNMRYCWVIHVEAGLITEVMATTTPAPSWRCSPDRTAIPMSSAAFETRSIRRRRVLADVLNDAPPPQPGASEPTG